MKAVLDTCALLALAAGTLPADAADVIRQAGEASVPSVTAWEIGIKVAGGKLQLNAPPARWFADLLEHYGLRELPLDAETACAAAALPPIHRDPFDRAIVALALARGAIIVTSDDRIRQYPNVMVRW